jgi:hypothetical protein
VTRKSIKEKQLGIKEEKEKKKKTLESLAGSGGGEAGGRCARGEKKEGSTKTDKERRRMIETDAKNEEKGDEGYVSAG